MYKDIAYFMGEVSQKIDLLQGYTSKRSKQHFSSNVKNVKWYSISNNLTFELLTIKIGTVKMPYTCEYSFTLKLLYDIVS